MDTPLLCLILLLLGVAIIAGQSVRVRRAERAAATEAHTATQAAFAATFLTNDPPNE